MVPSPPRRTVAYTRVSTEDQAVEGYSLPEQQRSCRLIAEAKAISEPGIWTPIGPEDVYEDAGISGTTGDRPALKRLIADAGSGTIGVVVFTKLDRLARRLKLLLEVWDQLEAAGVHIYCIKESIDTSNAVGRLIRNVLGSIAEFERDQIAERTSTGRFGKARRGEIWRTRPPFGYRYVTGSKESKTPGRLEIDSEAAPIVRRIFETLAAGKSSRALAAELTVERVPTQRGARLWRHSTLGALVHNPVYYGRATYGRRCRINRDGKSIVRFSDPANVQYVDVPPIVSKQLWDSVQMRLSASTIMNKRHAKWDYLLGGGLLRCGVRDEHGNECGSVMRGERRGSYFYYRCSALGSDSRLRQHSVYGDVVEDAVRTAIGKTLLDPERVLSEIAALADDGTQQAQTLEKEIAYLERAVAAVESEHKELLSLRLKRLVDDDRYAATACDLTQRQRALQERVTMLGEQREAVRANQLPIADVKAACALLGQGIENMDTTEWRWVLSNLCHRISATRETVIIEGVLPALSTAAQTESISILAQTAQR